MVNLVNTPGWLREMFIVNRKSHVMRHILTLRIFGTLKKLCFWQNREKVFNQLNSTNWVELHKSHVQGSRSQVTWRDHRVRSRAGGMQVARGNLHLQMGRVQQCRLKHRCQLIVRLKTNKCYQKLLHYLSSYTHLLNIRLFAQVSSLCVSAIDNVIVTTPGFVQILSLVIFL